MQLVACSSLTELQDAVRATGDDVLFRGQVKHYALGDGRVSLTTSFARDGCIPPLMLKWAYYAREILAAFTGDAESFDIAFTQAFLQHYGWRSFFVDATASPSVAAWFASHRFTRRSVIHAAEDCHEVNLLAMHNEATYERAAGIGHIYVISRAILRDRNIRMTDLSMLVPTDRPAPRLGPQQAWLIGPLDDAVPPEAVITQISAPISDLAEFASFDSLRNTVDLFPPQEEDVFLRLLLSVPWVSAGAPGMFRRGLDIPEYDLKFTKFYPPEYAFPEDFWIAERRGDGQHGHLEAAAFYRVAEEAFFGRERPRRAFPKLRVLLSQSPVTVIEMNRLVRHPEFATSSEYAKGVVITSVDQNLFEVSELSVDHPATVLAGVGQSMGWHYTFDHDDQLSRVLQASDCPCNNSIRHRRHLALVDALGYALEEKAIRMLGEHDFQILV
jgi:hypothetical protein